MKVMDSMYLSRQVLIWARFGEEGRNKINCIFCLFENDWILKNPWNARAAGLVLSFTISMHHLDVTVTKDMNRNSMPVELCSN